MTTQVATDLLLGRLTPTMAAQAVCRDQWQCARDYYAAEDSWRRTVAEKVESWAGDHCPQCGGRFVTVAEVAAALLAPDSLPEGPS